MIQGIGIFILFLFPLILVHEIGHFLFARLFGVRVEVFSIGFGPKLFKFVRGGTQYAVSLIPLGGYIKMFGDDPFKKDEIAECDKQHSFNHKGKWARFWIVFGGPLTNLIFAFAIFFALLLIGERVPEVRFGVIEKETSFFSKGIRTGDVLLRMNGLEVSSPTDMAITEDEQLKTITIKRGVEEKVLSMSMPSKDFFSEFAKYPPLLRTPIVVDEAGEAYIVSKHSDRADWMESLDEMNELVGTKQFYLYHIKDIASKAVDLSKKFTVELNGSLAASLISKKYYPRDMIVEKTTDNSPAVKAGIKSGDIIIALNATRITSFEDLRKTLQKTEATSVSVDLLRNGKVEKVSLTPQVKEIEGEKRKMIGVYSSAIYLEPRFIDAPSKGVIGSLVAAHNKTWDMIGKTLIGFGKLISNQVSFKNVGGPIAIGKVATDSFNMSLSYFFQIMAIVSINLGLINLFPIPILDGGHIVFILLEAINRGPISRRKMEIAQQFGLSLLLLLMVGALYNDIVRIF